MLLATHHRQDQEGYRRSDERARRPPGCARCVRGRARAFALVAASELDGSAGVAPVFSSGVLLHIHDEASLRLRSSTDASGSAPSRGRSSKVQQHVTSVHFQGQQPLRWHAELDALSNKTAHVLATSLHRLLRMVAAAVCPPLSVNHDNHAAWFLHILVGDGVGTNEAAATFFGRGSESNAYIVGLIIFFGLSNAPAIRQASLSAVLLQAVLLRLAPQAPISLLIWPSCRRTLRCAASDHIVIAAEPL